jgi:hypothetical protein
MVYQNPPGFLVVYSVTLLFRINFYDYKSVNLFQDDISEYVWFRWCLFCYFRRRFNF